jgi:preprotein translocase subunit SecF
VTTLIAGLALLAFGSGPVRGFAVVHCIGILTSMFSAVFFSRGLVNLWYGARRNSRVFPSAGLEARGRHRRGGRTSGHEIVCSGIPCALRIRASSENSKGGIEIMEFFRIRKDIPFMKHALIFNAISFITFALACLLPAHPWTAPVGGVHRRHGHGSGLQPARRAAKVRETVSGLGYADVQVQNFGTARDVMIRLPVQKGVTSAQQSEQVLGRSRRRPRGDAAPHRVRRPAGRRGAGARTASWRWPWWCWAS